MDTIRFRMKSFQSESLWIFDRHTTPWEKKKTFAAKQIVQIFADPLYALMWEKTTSMMARAFRKSIARILPFGGFTRGCVFMITVQTFR